MPLTEKSLSEILTIVRPSPATHFNEAGEIVVVIDDAVRIDYDPESGACLGLLVEADPSTNYIIGADTPETQIIAVTNQFYTLSFYGDGQIDVSGTYSISLKGDTYPARSSVVIYPTAGNITLTISGDVRYAQLEPGVNVSSYIHTDLSPMVRAAEAALIRNTMWLNRQYGTLVIEHDPVGQNPIFSSGNYELVPFGVSELTALVYGSDGNAYVSNGEHRFDVDFPGFGPTVNLFPGVSGHIREVQFYPVRKDTYDSTDDISDVILSWNAETDFGVAHSNIGINPTSSYSGTMYDESGNAVGPVPAVHGDKGVWVGPAYSNLFSGPVEAQTKALTAQKYTVWCDTGSVVCGAYGTATPSTPLTFTATAGDCTFTPTGVTKWMLTATVAPMPYVAPGTSVASAAGSATNGLSWALSAEMTAALSGACTVAAEVTIGISGDDMTIGSFYGILSCKDTNQELLHMSRGSSVGEYRIVRSTDGFAVGFINSPFNRYERHVKIIQTNADGTQFRVGNKRVGIDSAIQWSGWATYDGSFNSLTHLRLAFGNTIPLWFRKLMVSNRGGLTDDQIETRVAA